MKMHRGELDLPPCPTSVALGRCWPRRPSPANPRAHTFMSICLIVYTLLSRREARADAVCVTKRCLACGCLPSLRLACSLPALCSPSPSRLSRSALAPSPTPSVPRPRPLSPTSLSILPPPPTIRETFGRKTWRGRNGVRPPTRQGSFNETFSLRTTVTTTRGPLTSPPPPAHRPASSGLD